MKISDIKAIREGKKNLEYNGNIYECIAESVGTLTFQNVNDDHSIRLPETYLFTSKECRAIKAE